MAAAIDPPTMPKHPSRPCSTSITFIEPAAPTADAAGATQQLREQGRGVGSERECGTMPPVGRRDGVARLEHRAHADRDRLLALVEVRGSRHLLALEEPLDLILEDTDPEHRGVELFQLGHDGGAVDWRRTSSGGVAIICSWASAPLSCARSDSQGRRTELLHRDPDGGQRWLHVVGERHVVVRDQREAARDVEAELRRRGHGADRLRERGGEYRRDLRGLGSGACVRPRRPRAPCTTCGRPAPA